MNDKHFRQLLNHFHLSWDGYRKVRKGVKKRVGRHMQQLTCRTMKQYLAVLDNDRDTRQHCDRLLTVSISRFFRDRRLWEVLEHEILPAMIKEGREKLKVWSAGCACGEEACSFSIMWHRIRAGFERLPELEIRATDVNPVYLDKARAGVYPRSSLREVPEALLARHFTPRTRKRSYTVDDSVKKGIVWQAHNLLTDSPVAHFQLIFLRNNLLTYYQDELKIPAFQGVVDSLVSGGFLIIGVHEKIPSGVPGLSPSPLHPCIFRKGPP